MYRRDIDVGNSSLGERLNGYEFAIMVYRLVVEDKSRRFAGGSGRHGCCDEG